MLASSDANEGTRLLPISSRSTAVDGGLHLSFRATHRFWLLSSLDRIRTEVSLRYDLPGSQSSLITYLASRDHDLKDSSQAPSLGQVPLRLSTEYLNHQFGGVSWQLDPLVINEFLSDAADGLILADFLEMHGRST